MVKLIKRTIELRQQRLFLEHLMDRRHYDSESGGIGVTCYMEYEYFLKTYNHRKSNMHLILRELMEEGYIDYTSPNEGRRDETPMIALFPAGKSYLRKLKNASVKTWRDIIQTVIISLLSVLVGILLGQLYS